MKENKSKRDILIVVAIVILITIINYGVKSIIRAKRYNDLIEDIEWLTDNTYSKYEKTVIAKIMSENTELGNLGRKSSYTAKIKDTGEIVNITNRSLSVIGMNDIWEGQDVLLNYYKLYDNDSNEYCGENYKIIPTARYSVKFNELDDNFYCFCDGNYIDKFIIFKVDSENTECFDDYIDTRNYEEKYGVLITSNYETGFRISKGSVEIPEEFNKTQISLGTIYDFNDNEEHYSVLNYGDEIKDSLVLISKEADSYSILDYIVNK